MGLTYVTVIIKAIGPTDNGKFESQFLVDTGATDSFVPGSELKKIGIQNVETIAGNSNEVRFLPD